MTNKREQTDAHGHPLTPDHPVDGGKIISGHGDEVPDQTEGGLVISGRGDEVPSQTAGGEILEGDGDLVDDPDPENIVVGRGHGQDGDDVDVREEERHGRHRAED